MKLFSLVTVILQIFLTAVPTHAATTQFADVQGTAFADAFSYLADQSIIHGYPDGTGRPLNYLNRAEAVKVVVLSRADYAQRAAFYQKNPAAAVRFSDVPAGHWVIPYLEVAVEKGIVTGYEDKTFRPERLLSTEEAIALLMRTFGVSDTSGAVATSPYFLNQANQWYTPFVTAAINRNLIMKQQPMRPGYAITRGQFFDMAYRMHSIQAQNVAAFADSTASQASQPLEIQAHTVQQTEQYNGSLQPIAPTAVERNTDALQYASSKPFAITIPKVGITDFTVTHPADPFSNDGVMKPLETGLGHLFSYPGGGGKIMVYGHSSSTITDRSAFTKAFRKINELAVGDRIYITYEKKLYVYEVTLEETVLASDTSRFNDTGGGEELILYTCWPPDSTTERYLVHAVPVETIAL